MDITITIPDELAPGVIASAHLNGVTPEEQIQRVAIDMATKVCQDLRVGPYYRGPTLPTFNPDGSLYDPDWMPPAPPESIEDQQP